MRMLLLMLSLFPLLSGCTGGSGRTTCITGAAGGWERLPSLPDREGFAGLFAGVSGGALLVAGGANFPDAKPWEGGKKVWYDTVFVRSGRSPGGSPARWDME